MINRFMSIYSDMNPLLQEALEPLFNHEDCCSGYLKSKQVHRMMKISNLNETELCLMLLPLATAYAITPLSHFNVGAIACGINGDFYFGANMELIGMPLQQTVHAEQSAVMHAWMRGETRLRTLTVSHVPCGYCRQFLNELNSSTDLKLCLPQRPSLTLEDYLPNSFGPYDLNIQHRLFDSFHHNFSATGWIDHGYSFKKSITLEDPLVKEVIYSSRQSYAPYSHSHSAIVLETQNGRLFSGRYAENAAFNPSLSPLQVALNLLNLGSSNSDAHYQITRAILAEREDARFTQWPDTLKILTQLGCHEIHHLTIMPYKS